MSDIEEIITPFWFKNISESNIQKCLNFINKYYFENYDLHNIKLEFSKFQKENSFNNILKFGSLLTIYKLGRIRGHYLNSNKELEEKLKVQNVRENSGVMVFSIFTSPYPSYTKINIDGTTEIYKEFNSDSNNTGQFTCKYDCSFCPKDPDMPKSYIASEPGVARALQNDFDPMKQIFDRGLQYIQQGHPIDKIEVIIQGGTWDSYSIEYRTEFIRDIYWTFNIFMDWIFYNKDIQFDSNEYIKYKDKKLRPKKSLEEEIKINETSSCRIIGLTPETRPDQINYQTIKFLRKIGATRVQLGVQHINDDILRYNNRGCYNKDTIRAIKMLKDNAFKCDVHFMLDMPKPEKYSQEDMILLDENMLNEINTNPDYKVDQMKIYPCVVTPHTTIKKWYDEGIYKPYGETIKLDKIIYKKMTSKEKLLHRLSNPLYKTILYFYSKIHPSIRVNRIIRDIPTNEICGGTTDNGMRSEIDRDLELLGLSSGDIRYREVGSYRHTKLNFKEPLLKELIFESSGGTEYFLSFESDDKDKPILYSFLRLRLSNNSGKTQTGKIIFPELVDCALIRELHTYGKVQPCKENQKYYQNNNILLEENSNIKTQHKGYGKKLLAKAEEIAILNGYKKIAVISGVGVREYYRANNYILDSEEGCYQIKQLDTNIKKNINNTFIFSICINISIAILKYNNII
jgi:histone acetyltransferase (RNA polymerase elongator complex component)